MENIKSSYKCILTIAGSDSGGCAGIQADIKSISACGAYAASVITATTAQNTQGVFDIHTIPLDHLERQLDAVLEDIHFDAVKIGMLHSSQVIKSVANALKKVKTSKIVVDPVMVAKGGARLINKSAIKTLKNKLIKKAYLITPNIPEAEVLTKTKIKNINK